LFAPVTQGLQREFDKLAEENKTLRAELERYRAQAGRQSVDNPPIAGPQPVARQAEVPPNRISEVSRPPVVRKHLVQQGETPTAIARRYGIKLDALMAANPGLDPKRMKVGQALNVPPAP
jgi:LysM repeat protein